MFTYNIQVREIVTHDNYLFGGPTT